MTRVVVTGGRGFIGQPVIEELTRRGYEAFPYGLEEGGIEDREQMHDMLRGTAVVIHLAGMLGTHELFDHVRRAVDVNVIGTINVMETCLEHGSGYVGITMPQVFPSIYTATKVCTTRLATAYRHSLGLPVSHVTAFNVFGPGQAYGPGHPQKIIPTFAIKALRGEPLPVWGDGEQWVDLIHTSHVAEMLVDATAFVDDDYFDAGTGEPFTVNEVAAMVLEITGSNSKIEYLPMRRGEIPTQIKAEGIGWDKLGWKPRFRKRDLVDTIGWYERHLELFQ